LVGARLSEYANGERNWQAWPSQGTLAADVGMSLRTVERAMSELDADGWLAGKRDGKGSKHTTHYAFLMANVTDRADGMDTDRADGMDTDRTDGNIPSELTPHTVRTDGRIPSGLTPHTVSPVGQQSKTAVGVRQDDAGCQVQDARSARARAQGRAAQ